MNEYYPDQSQGVVFVSGKEYYWLTIVSIKYIRDKLHDDIPIEIFMPHKDKHDQFCNKMRLVFGNIFCSYFDQYLPRHTIAEMSGYQFKSLALLLTRFTNVLYLDSDNIPLIEPSKLFESEKYKTHGMIVWPDFWKRSTNPLYYSFTNLQFEVIGTTPSVESGQMLINKKTHLKTLLLSYYYNLYGPAYFYPLFSQGFPGEGDKESFYLASRATKEGSFLPSGIKTHICGVLDSKNAFSGNAILQVDPSDFNKIAFFHCNYPKIQVDKLDEYYYKDKVTKSNRRSWSLIRGARKENENNTGLKSLKEKLNFDLELAVWECMVELCSVDFKGFRLFDGIGNDEMADQLKERVAYLKHAD
ncbi:unnamed protein product [Ambrosiozyma monospora]|uniref:Unnamed protein product n=1 Tax=Ambrosiozyma monospora TaxID=43982 RepID=A0ACB5TFX3_AMBMO|nr:unnamed protein product [Ambrosiozyma monospora]